MSSGSIINLDKKENKLKKGKSGLSWCTDNEEMVAVWVLFLEVELTTLSAFK